MSWKFLRWLINFNSTMGCDSSKTDSSLQSLNIFTAIQQNDWNEARNMIKKGININCINFAGRTPLMKTCRCVLNHHSDEENDSEEERACFVSFLLENGAYVDRYDIYGWTARRYAENLGLHLIVMKLKRKENRISVMENRHATRVCSSHFLPSEIQKTLTGKRKLVQGAIPSVFAWSTTETPKRPCPRRRLAEKFNENVPSAPKQICAATNANADDDQMTATPCASLDHDYGVPPTSTEDRLQAALEEVNSLENKISTLQSNSFCIDRFSNDSTLINFYTGFKNYNTLKSVFMALQPTALSMVRWSQMQRHANKENVNVNAFHIENLQLIDQFFLFLCRVRQGFPEQDLAVRFGISQSSVSRILITWSNYLYVMLGTLPLWPSRDIIDTNMPDVFKCTYPKTRVILDCTEIKVQTPSSKVLNSETYSSYKSHTTFKSLIGISPDGAVSFVSSLYTGSISDKAITERSGILDLLEPNDEVMADKGFLIEDLLRKKGASLVIPPFLGEKGKFSKDEVQKTHEIARLRIQVERAIRRVKEYHIFDKVIPLNIASSINQIWSVCVILTNFRGPLF